VMVGLGHLNYLLANGVAITLCSLANFLVSETWVFVEDVEAVSIRNSSFNQSKGAK
jgi:putative flippase GtrA